MGSISADAGSLQVLNVVGVDYVDEGESLRFECIDSIPPHGTKFVTLLKTYISTLSKHPKDGFPLTVIDLTWRTVLGKDAMRRALHASAYGLFDASGEPALCGNSLIVAHFEGDLVGDVIAQDILISGSTS